MAINEQVRHQIHLKLEESLGPEIAAAVMELLPPVGWADVATKSDLEHHAEVNKTEHEHITEINRREHEALVLGLREEIRAQGERLEHELRSQLFKIMTFMTTLAAVSLVVARLFS